MGQISTKGSRSTTHWLTTPYPQGCSSTNLPPPPLPKDNEEVSAHVKNLQAMLDAATVVDPDHERDDEARGHELDHRQSLCGDSTSSLTSPKEHSRGRDLDNRDLHDTICGRDAHGRIENLSYPGSKKHIAEASICVPRMFNHTHSNNIINR
jgi:hypothetical protein